MHRMTILGREIHYRKMGNGPPIVLIHGYGGSHLDWAEVGEVLSKNHTVYLPHFSHHYLDPKQSLNFINLINLVAGFVVKLREVHHEPVNIAGSSFGAALAWGVAIRHSESVAKICLVSPMPPNPANRLRDKRMKILLKIARIPTAVGIFLSSPLGRLMLPYLEDVFQLPWSKSTKLHKSHRVTRRMLRMISHSVERFEWIVRNEDWTYWESRLAHVQAPTLILCGEKDLLFAHDEPKRFFKLFKHAELRIVTEGGHVMSRELAQDVSILLDRFFTNKESTLAS